MINRNFALSGRPKKEKIESAASSVRMANGKAISASLLSKLKTQIAENEKQKYCFIRGINNRIEKQKELDRRMKSLPAKLPT